MRRCAIRLPPRTLYQPERCRRSSCPRNVPVVFGSPGAKRSNLFARLRGSTHSIPWSFDIQVRSRTTICGNMRAAVIAAKEALGSGHLLAHRWLAAALGQVGRLEDAKQALEDAIALTPKISRYVCSSTRPVDASRGLRTHARRPAQGRVEGLREPTSFPAAAAVGRVRSSPAALEVT